METHMMTKELFAIRDRKGYFLAVYATEAAAKNYITFLVNNGLLFKHTDVDIYVFGSQPDRVALYPKAKAKLRNKFKYEG